MAVINVTTSDNLATAYNDAGAGDEIAMAAGTYQASDANAYAISDVRSSGSRIDKSLTFRAANPLNRPKFSGVLGEFRRVNDLTFQNIDFVGRNTQAGATTPSGGPVPSQQKALDFKEFDTVNVLGCRFDFYRVCIGLSTGGTQASASALVDHCEFTRSSMDPIITWATLNGATLSNSAFFNEAISPALSLNPGTWHPDMWQVALNAGPTAHSDFSVLNVLLSSVYMKGFFVSDDQLEGQQLLDGVIIDNFQATTGRQFGLGLEGCGDVEVKNSLLRYQPGGPDGKTQIRFKAYRRNVSITNTVVDAAALTENGTATSGSFTNNETVSKTAFPAGYTALVVGENVGVVVAGETPLATPVVPTDGRCAASTWDVVGTLAGVTRYAPTIRIPSTAPGHAAAGDPRNVQWRRPAAGITDPQPTEVGVPPASGSPAGYRYRLASTGTAGLAGSSVPPLTAMEDVEFRVKRPTDSVFSGWSGVTGPGNASPSAPAPGTLDPLQNAEWGVHAVVEYAPGFYTLQVWVAPATGPATAFEWTPDNGATWAPSFYVAQDGSDRPVFQIQPSTFGGQDHVVGYDQDKAVRGRYYTAAGAGTSSIISVGSKTLEGPAAPAAVLTPGSLLRSGASRLVMGGAVCVVPRSTKPATPARELYSVVDNGDDTITVAGPIDPPLGALRVYARMIGVRPERLTSGDTPAKRATLPRGSGQLVYVYGVSADGVAGKPLPLELPAAPG